jgi:predicted nucleic acid-binding Zn ribbon protein
VADYVVTALVHEPTVMPIEEDMKVCSERARQILEGTRLGRRYMETSETYFGALTRQLVSLLEVGDAGRAFGLRSLTECPYAVIFPFAIALRIWDLVVP